MKIEVIKTFLDGRNRFEPGEVRQVPDDLGAYFCANGWSRDLAGEVATGDPGSAPVELDIDDLHHANHMEDAG